MKPGPKPKPTKLVVLHGDSHKKKNRKEPQPTQLIPPMPDYLALEPEAAARWQQLTQALFRLGLITEVDAGTLAIYCSNWALARKCARIIKRRGSTVRTPSGYLMAHPLIPVKMKAELLMMKSAAEFGLTPSSRTRLTGAATGGVAGDAATSADLTLGGLLDGLQ